MNNIFRRQKYGGKLYNFIKHINIMNNKIVKFGVVLPRNRMQEWRKTLSIAPEFLKPEKK